jgi:hypothetical protein
VVLPLSLAVLPVTLTILQVEDESVSSAVEELAWAELKQFYVQVTPPHHQLALCTYKDWNQSRFRSALAVFVFCMRCCVSVYLVCCACGSASVGGAQAILRAGNTADLQSYTFKYIKYLISVISAPRLLCLCVVSVYADIVMLCV